VLLPFDAKEGSYRADIGPAGGAPLAGLGTTLPADADRCLTLLLPDLPGPGSYDLTLRPDSPGGETLYRYPFVLLPPAGPGGRP
jgi:hypothetical protein